MAKATPLSSLLSPLVHELAIINLSQSQCQQKSSTTSHVEVSLPGSLSAALILPPHNCSLPVQQVRGDWQGESQLSGDLCRSKKREGRFLFISTATAYVSTSTQCFVSGTASLTTCSARRRRILEGGESKTAAGLH